MAVAAPAAPHAAGCVAALKAREGGLAGSAKTGDAAAEAELLTVVRSGIAFIGAEYLAGLREAEARELLKAAEQDFEALPAADAARRQAECLQEGEALYTGASALERGLITSAAKRRVRRLLAAS